MADGDEKKRGYLGKLFWAMVVIFFVFHFLNPSHLLLFLGGLNAEATKSSYSKPPRLIIVSEPPKPVTVKKSAKKNKRDDEQ